MKIFLDTANIDEIKKMHDLGVIDGVTTNPSLVAKEKGDYGKTIAGILKIVDGPISVEAVSEGTNEIVSEAIKLSKLSHNVVVKIPITREGLKAIKILSKKGIKTNATLAFSANQTLLAAKVGATYVSIFIGRLDDNGHDGMQVVRDTVEIFKQYNLKTEIIVASIRHPLHVTAAAKSGAHIATIPFDVLERMIKHPLTDVGIKKFLDDWNKRG